MSALAEVELPVYEEEPRLMATLGLVALPTAVSVARMFVANTLYRWRARSIEDRMQAVTGELVDIAVQATGPAERTSWTGIAELSSIKLRMMGFAEYVVIEVVDRHDEPLVLPDGYQLPEGKELPLVAALAQRWGSYVDPIRGRVMWAEIPVHELTDKGLPKRKPSAVPPPVPDTRPTEFVVNAEVLRRVLDGLAGL
jgi:hypothetical protein